MSILCRLGQHQPGPEVRANGGVAFGSCRGCGSGLILSASGWRPVPRGYRIVWRSDPPERCADPAQLDLELAGTAWPPAGARRIARLPAAAVPRPKAPRTGRMIALAGRAGATA